MARLLPVLLLVGCPYVFGPPDLSNVDRDGAPTAATADTATQIVVPTADTSLPEPAPVEATARPISSGLVIELQAPDPDERLWGGTVTLSGLDAEQVLSIPTDLDWEPTGTTRLLHALQDPCASRDDTLSIELRDQDGVLLAATELQIRVDGRGILDHTEPPDLGEVGHDTVFCGTIDRPSDLDRTVVTLPRAGQWRFLATWTNLADLDLALRDEKGTLLGQSATVVQPETVMRELDPGTFVLAVFHYGGAPPDHWMVQVEQVGP